MNILDQVISERKTEEEETYWSRITRKRTMNGRSHALQKRLMRAYRNGGNVNAILRRAK